MAKEDLKQMLNRVTIQGTLMDNTIENKVDKKGRKYLSGELEVMTDNDYIIPISVFAYELKNSGEKNTIYERLAKMIDYPSARTVGVQKAPKIAVSNARIEDNSFYSERDNRIVSNWRIGGSFVRAAASDAINQNSFEVQGVISSIKEVIDKEGNNTDTYDLKLLNVGFGNRVNELTLRFDDPAAVKYINGNYNVGDLVTLCGEIVYEQHERVVEKELGFGEPIKQTYTNTIRLLKITAGTPPVEPDESGYNLKDLQGIVTTQNNEITEKYNARAQVTAATNKAAGANLLF
jgi:hypothetical protein